MTKRQARAFFYVCTVGFAVVFVGMTVHSHTQFDELTNADAITPSVTAGKDVWHQNNCINCHTIFGEGAYYAPDLTKIAQQRGRPYLKAFLQNPSQFYSEEKHRRVMPDPQLTDEEIEQVIDFLDWVSKVDNQGWPPRPILVSGGTFPGTATVGTTPTPAAGAPEAGLEAAAAKGQELFRTAPASCFGCHSTVEGVNLAGPSLSGVATRAEQLVQSAEYQGEAKDAAGYLLESIQKPSAHLMPGAMYSAGGVSFMPSNYSQQLSAEQIDHLVQYLLTLK